MFKWFFLFLISNIAFANEILLINKNEQEIILFFDESDENIEINQLVCFDTEPNICGHVIEKNNKTIKIKVESVDFDQITKNNKIIIKEKDHDNYFVKVFFNYPLITQTSYNNIYYKHPLYQDTDSPNSLWQKEKISSSLSLGLETSFPLKKDFLNLGIRGTLFAPFFYSEFDIDRDENGDYDDYIETNMLAGSYAFYLNYNWFNFNYGYLFFQCGNGIDLSKSILGFYSTSYPSNEVLVGAKAEMINISIRTEPKVTFKWKFINLSLSLINYIPVFFKTQWKIENNDNTYNKFLKNIDPETDIKESINVKSQNAFDISLSSGIYF